MIQIEACEQIEVGHFFSIVQDQVDIGRNGMILLDGGDGAVAGADIDMDAAIWWWQNMEHVPFSGFEKLVWEREKG